MAPVVEALQALRGVAFVTAVTVVCEVGDIRRFAKPRQLMAFLGLVPGERSSGETRRQGGITKAGNVLARAVLVEAAWSYRSPAKIGAQMMLRQEGIPQAAKDIGWKAQVRLCGRYRRLMARGKKSPLATTAVARELVGFELGRKGEVPRLKTMRWPGCRSRSENSLNLVGERQLPYSRATEVLAVDVRELAFGCGIPGEIEKMILSGRHRSKG
jgi:hypothetical protein